MTIQSYQSNIARLLNEIPNLEKQESDELKKELEKAKQNDQIVQSITSSTSLSTLANKQQQSRQLSYQITGIRSKRASISKKRAESITQLHKCQQELLKEGTKERNRVEQFERRLRKEQLEHQRALTRELDQHRSLALPFSSQPQYLLPEAQKPIVHDGFISHASEDKDEFVRPLAQALEHLGFDIWYDELQLRIGDSLRRSIDRGLANSRYGIVVLSSAFFAKNWPQYELDGLVAKEVNSGAKVVLPIWHKVSQDEVMSYSPSLADKVALKSSSFTIQELAEELAKVLRC